MRGARARWWWWCDAATRGLNGAADLAHEQEVRVFELGAFVERGMRKLTNGS